MKRTPEERFWAKVGPRDDPTKCWLWTGATTCSAGVGRLQYGRFKVDGHLVSAHRLSYEMHYHVIIPEGMTIDHVKVRGCISTLCVNPYHLEVVTQKVNVFRGNGMASKRAKQTYCVHGHPLTDSDIYVYSTSPGSRHCRICVIERSRKSAVMKKEGYCIST